MISRRRAVPERAGGGGAVELPRRRDPVGARLTRPLRWRWSGCATRRLRRAAGSTSSAQVAFVCSRACWPWLPSRAFHQRGRCGPDGGSRPHRQGRLPAPTCRWTVDELGAKWLGHGHRKWAMAERETAFCAAWAADLLARPGPAPRFVAEGDFVARPAQGRRGGNLLCIDVDRLRAVNAVLGFEAEGRPAAARGRQAECDVRGLPPIAGSVAAPFVARASVAL